MYCYTRVRVDEKLYANLEHAIEKSNSDKLIECVPNIGLSCPVCNQTFKRIGEKYLKTISFNMRNLVNVQLTAVNNVPFLVKH